MNVTKIVKSLLLLIFTLPVLVSCRQLEAEPPLEEVIVQLKWLHQAQFAGFYAADQKGYYADEGISITFIEGGPTIDTRAPVLSGEAHFGVAGADELIVDRAAGRPLIAISTIYRRSPIVFVAAADSGILTPEDLVGKKILTGLNAFPTLRAMMTRLGISPDEYIVESHPFDVELFAPEEFPVWGVYTTGSIQILKDAGYELNLIYPGDYGVHFYNDTIFASEDFIDSNPDLVLRFLRATLRGWRWAIENPEEAAKLTLEYNSELDAEIQILQMEASVPLIHTGEGDIGCMQAEVWESMYQTLLDQGILETPYTISDAYTMDFVEQIYTMDD